MANSKRTHPMETTLSLFMVIPNADRSWKCRVNPMMYFSIHTRHDPQNAYYVSNLRVLKSSPLKTIPIFECMGRISCVKFQRHTLKCLTKYLIQYTETRVFYSELKSDLRSCKRLWNGLQICLWITTRPVVPFINMDEVITCSINCGMVTPLNFGKR